MVQPTRHEEPIDAEPSPQATLRALLLRLTDENRLLFKRALVEETIRIVTPLLPPEDADEGHRGGITSASRWLADPSNKNEEIATSFWVAERIDGGVRHWDYPEVFLCPAMVAGAEGAEEASHFALTVGPGSRRVATPPGWRIGTPSSRMPRLMRKCGPGGGSRTEPAEPSDQGPNPTLLSPRAN